MPPQLKGRMIKMDIIRTGPLGVNTYILPCSFVNEGDSKAFFVVDPGGHAPEIIKRVAIQAKEYGAKKGHIHAIVLTHGHFDHLGAVCDLKKEYPNALLCIHENDKEYLGNTGYAIHKEGFDRFGLGYIVDQLQQEFPDMPNVDIFLQDGQKLEFAKEWKIIHTPGHSPGSVSLYNETDNVLLSGDTLFAASYGRTDLRGGSFSQLKQSLKLLLKLPVQTRVFPGHESATTIGVEQKNLASLGIY